MIEGLFILVLTQLPVLLFGAGVAFLPSFDGSRVSLRLSAAWLTGTAMIAVVSPLLALTGGWGERSIAVPLIVASAAVALTARRRSRRGEGNEPRQLLRVPPSSSSVVLIAGALALLAVAISSGRAISAAAYRAELAQGERWAHAGLKPELPLSFSPSAPPLPSTAPMWSSMLRSETGLEAGAWLPFLLFVSMIPIFRAALSEALDSRAWLATAGIITACSVAVISGSLAGSAEAWLIVLAPALVAVAGARNIPGTLQVIIAALTGLAHPAGLSLVLVVAALVAVTGRRRTAVRLTGGAVAALAPWWILLLARGVSPWAVGSAVHVVPWYPADAALLLIAAVSLVLIIGRARRIPAALPAIGAATVLLTSVGVWTVSSSDFWLHSLRMASPVAALAAFLLTLRAVRAKRRAQARSPVSPEPSTPGEPVRP